MTTLITNQASLSAWLSSPSTVTATLSNDITINPSTWTLSGSALGSGYTLLGNYKTITITPTSAGQTWPGLINLNGGTIQYLNLTEDETNGTVTLASNQIGWLIGNQNATGTCTAVIVSGLLSITTNEAGGIAGKGASMILNDCQYGTDTQYGSITGTGSGGLVGSFSNGMNIQQSLVYTNITGNDSGGMLGRNSSYFQISESRSMGTLSTGTNQGGFVGNNALTGTFLNSHSLVTINNSTSGGFIGGTLGGSGSINNMTMQNCYYLGTAVANAGAVGNLGSTCELNTGLLATSTQIAQTGSTATIDELTPVSFMDNFFANNVIRVIKKDGSGNWWIGGSFIQIGFSSSNFVTANRIVKFDGKKFTPLGVGVNGNVNDINIVGNNVYVCGEFTNAGGKIVNRIAYWNTSNNTWNAMGNNLSLNPTNVGTSGNLFSMVYDGSTFLYIGGDYLYANGTSITSPAITVNHIARWNVNTLQWSAIPTATVGVGSFIHVVIIISVSGSPRLYVGGNFTTAGGVSALYIAYYDINANTWNSVGPAGSGFGSGLNSFSANGTDLYISGAFTTVTPGPVTLSSSAKLDTITNTYTALGSPIGPGGNVNNITYVNGYVMALGTFANRISYLKITENIWKTINITTPTTINNWAKPYVESGICYIPNYQASYTNSSPYLTVYNTQTNTYSNFINSLNGLVLSSAYDSTNNILYLGGTFTTIGTTTVNFIVSWNFNINTWSALGSGLTGPNEGVRAILIVGTKIYVGGSFTTAGGSSANRIAVWDTTTSTWSALGTGLSDTSWGLGISGNNIYVVGNFTIAGGSAINRVAVWNTLTSTWSGLGTPTNGISNRVRTIAVVSATEIYVAGDFTTTSSGTSVNRIAKWDGSTWSALGTGLNNIVQTITISGSNLYIGGDFTTAGGSTANRIAVWNTSTSTWSALGSGFNNSVSAIALSGSNIYAGGYFTTAGGSNANRVAVWNGSSWNTLLGSVGVNDYIATLSLIGNNLYVGGNFISNSYNTPSLSPYLFKINTNANVTNYSTGSSNTTDPIASFSSTIWNKTAQPPSLYATSSSPYYSKSISYNGGTNLIQYQPVQNAFYIFNQNDLQAFLTRSMNYTYTYGTASVFQGILYQNIDINPATWPNINTLTSLGTGYTLHGSGKIITLKPQSAGVSWYGLLNLSGGTVQHFTFQVDQTSGSIAFASNGMGGVVGNSYSSGNIIGVYTSGFNVTTTGSGAIVGSYSSCTINTCQNGSSTSSSTISGTGAGGIAGSFFSGTITEAMVYETISGTKAGGIVGSDANATTLNKCKVNGTVSGANAGGLMGGDSQNNSTINNSYSLATVNNATAGGFTGNDSGYNGSLIMNNNYFLGTVNSGTTIGYLSNGNQLNMNDFASNGLYDDLSEGETLLCNYKVERFGNNSSFTGVNGIVYVSVYNSNNNSLYIGGTFTNISGSTIDINGYAYNRLARYSFTDNLWYAVGNGVDGEVRAMHLYSSNLLYVGGAFTTATQTNASVLTVNRIAEFNISTSTWSALSNTSAGITGGTGLVRDIKNIGTTLYVAGAFTTAGGNISSNGIVQWGPIGSSPAWSRLATNATGIQFGTVPVTCLCVSGTNLYLGGSFTSTTDSTGVAKSTTRIARWNPSTTLFEYIGGNTSTTNGLDFTVNSIVLDPNGTDIWVGGAFTLAQNTLSNLGANYLVKWNVGTSTWSNPLNIGIGANVNTLYRTGNELHISGSFSTSINGNLTKNYYLMYNIATGQMYSYNYQLFTASGFVNTMVKIGNYIYLGGSFSFLYTNPTTGPTIMENLGNICQLNTTFNTTSYSNSFPSSNPPISFFNS